MPLEKSTGILRVASSYDTHEVGTGILVKVSHEGRERSFVFTCAHLTGGKDPTIADIPLDSLAIGRRTDAFNDIDLVEIDSSKLGARAFAAYEKPSELETESQQAWLAGSSIASWRMEDPAERQKVKKFGSLQAKKESLAAWRKTQSVLQATPETSPSDTITKLFALVPPWSAKESMEAGKKENWTSVQHNPLRPWNKTTTRTSPFAGTLWTPARIAPGMSCSPLLNKKGRLLGMGVEFKNRLLGSTFVTGTAMVGVLTNYLNKDEAKNSIPASWHSQNGLLYLKIGNENAEIIPSRIAGNPSLRPSGNGVSTPPGNGVSTPPGKGVSKIEKCDPKALSAESDWKKIGSPPAILWQGKPVMGFSVQFDEKPPLLVYPDRSGIKLRLQGERYVKKMTDVPLGSPVLSWLDARYRQNYSIPPSYTAISDDDLAPRLRRLGVTNGPKIHRHRDYLKITFEGSGGRGEKVEFLLNEKGALIEPVKNNPDEFLPVIEVPGPSGQVYIVDLSDLFFSNATEWGVGTNQENLELYERVLNGDPLLDTEKFRRHAFEGVRGGLQGSAIPTISYRAKCSEREFSFIMAYVRPISADDESPCEDAAIEDVAYNLGDIQEVIQRAGNKSESNQ